MYLFHFISYTISMMFDKHFDSFPGRLGNRKNENEEKHLQMLSTEFYLVLLSG